MTAKRLEAALSLRAGISGDKLVKDMGEETVEAAMKDADMPPHRHPRRVHEDRGDERPAHVRQPGDQGGILDRLAPWHPLERREQEAHAGV